MKVIFKATFKVKDNNLCVKKQFIQGHKNNQDALLVGGRLVMPQSVVFLFFAKKGTE